MRAIGLVSSKGGTGKTTTALNLAVALADKGRRTLLVDVDPQGAVGLALRREDSEWAGLAEVLAGQAEASDVVVQSKLANLALLTRGRLDPVDAWAFEQRLLASEVLEQALGSLNSSFDYAVIDTPAGLGSATRAALNQVDCLLILLQARPLALRSVTQVLRVVEQVQRERQGAPELLGLLATMVDLEQTSSLEVMREMWSGFAGILDTYIPSAQVFEQASQEGLPVGFLGGRIPPEARKYELLADEVESLIAELAGTPGEDDARPRREII